MSPPWQASDAVKHDKKAVGPLGVKWAKIANSVLAKSGSESKAIKVASAVVGHHVRRAAKKGGGI